MIDRIRAGDPVRIRDMTMTTAGPLGRPDPLLEARPVAYVHELTATHREGAAVFHALPDPTPAAALDVLVETVCDLLDVDYAGVHLVRHDVHHVLASSDAVQHAAVPRSDSLCGVLLARYVPASAGGAAPPTIIEVSDTAADPTLPYAAGTDVAPVRFYAATPLLDESDRLLGTLCVIAHHPRSLTGPERRTLLLLGMAASRLVGRCASGVDG